MACNYTGNTAYPHNPVGQEKEVSLKNRLEKKEPLVKLIQLCV
jgi:hypothetical protein